MPKRFLAALVAAAFIFTGCSASGEPTTTDAQPAAEAETSGPASEEFASIIAQSRRDVDEWLDTWDENGCSSIGITTGTDIMACELSLISGGLIAETSRLKLDSATKIEAPAYIGDPPDEINIIWQSTEDAATAASEAGENLPDVCESDEGCGRKIIDFLMAMEDLQSSYDSWEPYM